MMAKFMVKVVVWVAVAVGVISFALPLTGFQATSSWQYNVQAAGNVTPITTVNASDEINTVDMDRTFDLGVMFFLLMVYTGGTAMGYLLKKRPAVSEHSYTVGKRPPI